MVRRRSNRLHSVVRALLPTALALLLLAACTDTARYDHYQSVEKPWTKDHIYYFTYDIDDNTVPYKSSMMKWIPLWLSLVIAISKM